MLGFMNNWIASHRQPALDWLQVEVTTRCNAACSYCPRTAYGGQWRDSDIRPDLFRKLLPVLAKAKMAHLQGWGEPFLHPDFFAMVRMAKKQGCTVGTTTNGMLMDDGMIDEIIESGIDMVSFSLAGFDGVNDAIRAGTESARVISAIRKLHLRRHALNKATPRIHVSFMLFTSTLREIEKIPHKLAGMGVDEIVVSTLDFVADSRMQSEAIRPVSRADYAWLCDELTRIAVQCGRVGLPFHYRLPSPEVVNPICTENVLKSAVIRADGAVSPCVYSALPAEGVAFSDRDGERPYEGIVLGSIGEAAFPMIWSGPEAVRFRGSFFNGGFYSICRACPKRSE